MTHTQLNCIWLIMLGLVLISKTIINKEIPRIIATHNPDKDTMRVHINKFPIIDPHFHWKPIKQKKCEKVIRGW